MKNLLFLLSFVMVFVSCSNDIGQNSKISECGGFKVDNFIKKAVCVENSPQKIVKLNPDEDKCKDYLKWEYNESSKVLSLTHLNSYLNCCGEHSIYVSENSNNSYTIIEDDEPEGIMGARCSCMCTYSFYTEIHNVKKESIKINLKVDVEENTEVETLLNNSVIDLTQGENSGKILIREFFSMGSCNE